MTQAALVVALLALVFVFAYNRVLAAEVREERANSKQIAVHRDQLRLKVLELEAALRKAEVDLHFASKSTRPGRQPR